MNQNKQKSQTEQRDLDFEKWFANEEAKYGQPVFLSKLDAHKGWKAGKEMSRRLYESDLMLFRSAARMSEQENYKLKKDINQVLELLKTYEFKSSNGDDGPLVNI